MAAARTIPTSGAARKIRVHELATELGMTNRELLDLARLASISVKAPSSSMQAAYADMLRRRAKREGLTREVQPSPLSSEGPPVVSAPQPALPSRGDVDPDELGTEQEYLDDAREAREAERHRLQHGSVEAANPKDMTQVRRSNERQLADFQPPQDAAAFGRIDCGEGRFYIGYQAVFDKQHDPLVVNWRTSLGTLFYEATYEEPAGVDRKRQYRFGPAPAELATFEDPLFDDLAERVEALEMQSEIDDVLLADLERNRDGEMREIVQTIRAAQHQIIRADLDQLLLVQGGPGTGKTAVALHRISWLLFNHRDRLSPSQVAVVGPNTTFVRYIKSVLPSLGDRQVRQLALSSLGPEVQLGIADPEAVRRLKGELRMTALIENGLINRVNVPDDGLEIGRGTTTLRLSQDELSAQVNQLRSYPYATGRRMFRDYLRRSARTEGAVVDSAVERIWPQLTAPAFLQDLLGSEARILRAGGDDFTATEVQALYRKSADRLSNQTWSESDIPLLDHAAAQITGDVDAKFDHVVVDEIQDVSPMQLVSLARRSTNGSMTILGDIAQSTGPWARDSWDDILAALSRPGVQVNTVELQVGYRVPRQAFEEAARLLPSIAPGINPPRVVRDGPEPVHMDVDDEDDLIEQTLVEAQGHLAKGLMVGVIATQELLPDLAVRFRSEGVRVNDGRSEVGSGTNLLTPEESKGLEFDAVIVVQPDEIVTSHARGGRLLYIALTRTTQHLTQLQVIDERSKSVPTSDRQEDLPAEAANTSVIAANPPGAGYADDSHLRGGGEQSGVTSNAPEPSGEPSLEAHSSAGAPRPRVVELLADPIADEIRSSVPESLWPQVIAAIAERLDVPQTDADSLTPG